MRLGDLDALKDEMSKVFFNDNDDMRRIEELIDNAPTVRVPENEVSCVLTMFGKCSYNETGCSDCEIKDKIRKAFSGRRPQGEWIDAIYTNNGVGVGMCNQCGIHKIIDNFCPNCGADMRKGEKTNEL